MKRREIDLADVQTGDILVVQDGLGNVVQGEATTAPEHIYLNVFNTRVIVARINRNNRMVAVKDIKIAGHQTVLPMFDE